MNDLRVLRVCNCPLNELSFRKAEVEFISQRKARLLSSPSKSEAPCAQGVCPKLQHLWIYSCRHLVKVGSMPKTLKTVDFSYCSALREIEGLPYLAGLEQLDISGCEEVEELPSLQRLKSLKSLKASKCYKLKSIEGLADLSRLQRLYVRDCHEIRELPCVENCRSLKALDARDCPKLQWADGVLDQLRQHLETCLVGYYDDGH
jgi:Leucine-rich repeat (LRR) protein